MKYARIIDNRAVDTVDLSDYDPRPSWGQTDKDLIDRIFAAVGGFAAFVAVPDEVEPYAYVNADGTFENATDHDARIAAEAEAEATTNEGIE